MTSNSNQGIGPLLQAAPLRSLCSEFSAWRINQFNRNLQKDKNRGGVLPFVRALRLSAGLIYLIREKLVGSGLTANWGHLLDDDDCFCSRECDVIIHRKEGQHTRWNGGEKPIMDFRFVKRKHAIVVISCKSWLTPARVDATYCADIKCYVGKVWLFAESCTPRSIPKIRTKAAESGYEKFWPLYTLTSKGDTKPAVDEWRDLLSEIEKLKR